MFLDCLRDWPDELTEEGVWNLLVEKAEALRLMSLRQV